MDLRTCPSASMIKSAMPSTGKCDVYFIERSTVRTLLSQAAQMILSPLVGVGLIKIKFEGLQREVE